MAQPFYHTILALILITTGCATGTENAGQPLIDISDSRAAPKTGAKSYILINANSNTILSQNNAHERLPPASLTKLLSLYIIENHLKNGLAHNDDIAVVSKKARAAEGSRMFLEEGTHETIATLIQGLIVTSGNDATITLAEHIAGSEEKFVELMNETAQKIGMHDSHFANATGLPHPNHYSTAYDLGLLAWQFRHDHPESMQKLSQKWLNYNQIKQHNRNTLLWKNPAVTGMKTGHTKEAGFCLVASATEDGQDYLTVVLGDKTEQSRNQSTTMLLQHGQRNFEHIAFTQDPDIEPSRVWYSTARSTQAKFAHPLTISIPKGDSDIHKSIHVAQDIFAPAKANDVIGHYTLYLDNKPIADANLVLDRDLESGSTLSAIRDWVAYHIQSLLNFSN
jgi:D-alanyl-D-alanine carboxypeptidase (penicillin-binding protein 5/6)